MYNNLNFELQIRRYDFIKFTHIFVVEYVKDINHKTFITRCLLATAADMQVRPLTQLMGGAPLSDTKIVQNGKLHRV
jgi:hypothetical protein